MPAPKTLNVTQTTSLGGGTTEVRTAITADNLASSAPTIAAAKTGVLSVRTSSTVGTLTMDPGHGFITGDVIDLFWDGGQQHDVVVGTVATNSVPISGGTGDALPTGTSPAITAMKRDSEDVTVIGNNIAAIQVTSDVQGFVHLQQGDGTPIKTLKFRSGDTYLWIDDSAEDNSVYGTNPAAGVTIGKVLFSHADSAAAHTISTDILYN